jgi:hypothetical protein
MLGEKTPLECNFIQKCRSYGRGQEVCRGPVAVDPDIHNPSCDSRHEHEGRVIGKGANGSWQSASAVIADRQVRNNALVRI